MMADSQVSVGGSLIYAWNLLKQHYRAIWALQALNSLAWTVLFAGVLAGNPALAAVGFTGMLMAKYPLFGALVRLASGPEHGGDEDFKLGAHGLQWRRMELRMFAADLLASAFLTVITLLVAVAVAALMLGVMLSQAGAAPTITSPEQVQQWINGPGAPYAKAANLVINIAVAFVSLRLSLSLVASASSGRVAVLRTWKLLRGNLLRIFAASLVVGLPLAVCLILSFGVGAAPTTGASGPLDPSETFAFALLSGILAGAVSMPLTAGLQIYFYKHLGPISGPEADGSLKR